MKYDYFVPTTYQVFIEQCLNLFKTNEPVSIMFPPKADRTWRIDQFIQDYRLKHLVKLDLIPEQIEDIDDIHIRLAQQSGNLLKKELGIFIVNADDFIKQKKFRLLEEIAQFQQYNHNLHFFFCFEMDILHPDIASCFIHTSIFSNLLYYSLYGQKDILFFIDYLTKRWKINLSKDIEKRIAASCGGHFWLVKYAVRMLRDFPQMNLDQIFATEQMQFRLGQIMNSFCPSELSVLGKLISGKGIINSIEKHSCHYLEKTGFITKNKINIPLFEDYLKIYLSGISLAYINHKIVLNDVILDSHFSKNEKKILRLLLINKNQIVTRDELAKNIWKNDSDKSYSDWAIDRLVARLRRKLTTLGLSKDLVKTQRNQGYLLELL